MLYVDVKFANMLGPRLRNFKHKGDYLWNFSCPVCGDSRVNKSKARAYIYKVKSSLFCKCHNCGYGAKIGNFIKYLDPVLYEEYVLENYREEGSPQHPRKNTNDTIPDFFRDTPTIVIDNILGGIKSLDKLRPDHPAVEYVLKRKIPQECLSLLYFAPKFKAYVNTVVPGKFDIAIGEHPRLIIPYLNAHGKCFAFQGRAFGNETPKYYTIKVDDDAEKIFGLDRVDYSKRVYITEGPLDSLFIPNAIAVSGSSFDTPTIEALKTNATIVYDNEPRSPELTRLIKKTIDRGFSVCLWPETIVEKDINEMVMSGMTPTEIVDIINQNTYNGAVAQLRFASWKKC